MKEYYIHTEPIGFLSILDLQMQEETGAHGTMTVTGYIEDEKEEEYFARLTGEVWEKVEKVGKDGDRQILFWGVVTDFSIDSGYHQKKMTLKITTGSCLLDREWHFRAYQDSSLSYEQIFNGIMEKYPQGKAVFNDTMGQTEGQLILQYHETDWQFLSRLASRKHQFLVAEPWRKGVVAAYALPRGRRVDFPEHGKYTMKKELAEYRQKRGKGLSELKEEDFLICICQCREHYQIGDYMDIQGRRLYIYRIESRLEGGEMLHNCYLRSKEGMAVPQTYGREVAGISLDAMVRKVKEDKVQAELLGDENRGQEIDLWYPYSTVYSTQDGTGWYCMPEPGDMVRLTIPGREEGDAFVVNSVHMATESEDRKDPNVKSFKSKYQKEVRFTPDSIVITNNQGTRIELTDQEGIHIVSAHSVLLEAAEDITVSSDTGSLMVAGTSSVSFKQGGTGILLDKGISFTGGELKVQ